MLNLTMVCSALRSIIVSITSCVNSYDPFYRCDLDLDPDEPRESSLIISPCIDTSTFDCARSIFSSRLRAFRSCFESESEPSLPSLALLRAPLLVRNLCPKPGLWGCRFDREVWDGKRGMSWGKDERGGSWGEGSP